MLRGASFVIFGWGRDQTSFIFTTGRWAKKLNFTTRGRAKKLHFTTRGAGKKVAFYYRGAGKKVEFYHQGAGKKVFSGVKKRTKENQRGKLFSAGESDLVSEAVQQNQKNIHWLTSMEIVKETKDNYLSMFLNLCDNHLVYTMR